MPRCRRFGALVILLALALAACGQPSPQRPPADSPGTATPVPTPPASPVPAPSTVAPAKVPALKPLVLRSAPIDAEERRLPRRYDAMIRRSNARFACWPIWEGWWAQLMTESAMRPDAVSPVGARGAAQIMPQTFAGIARKIDLGVADPFDFQTSSDAGCFYQAERLKTWKSPRPTEDRENLAASGYNAGDGNIINAQKRCATTGPDGRQVLPVLYTDIIACLPQITGPDNAAETINYVKRIRSNTARKIAGA